MRAALLALALLATPAFAQTANAPADTMDARFARIVQADEAWRRAQDDAPPDEDAPQPRSRDRLPDVTPAAYATKLAHWEDMLRQLQDIDPAALSPAQRINHAVLKPQLERKAAAIRLRDYEMPFNADSSFWSNLGFMARGTPKDAAGYRAYAARLRDMPRHFDAHIANMRAGLARGFSVPRATLDGRDVSIAQVAELADPEKSVFYDPYRSMPASIPAAEQAALRAEGRKAVADAVIPAHRTLLQFFRGEYMPKARTTLAAQAMPGGEAWYAEQIRKYTTLDLAPGEIHRIGLQEVAAIRAEMDAIIEQVGFNGRSPQTRFQDFLAFLRSDPQFYAKTPEELLSRAAWIAKRIDGQIGKHIGTLPRARFTIIEVPPNIAPFWTAGRGGMNTYWLNTYDLPSRPLYNLPALTLHEAEPGHALQGALVAEQGELPLFRREYISAYGEGWGLYSEWLGKEMGIYQTPYEDFGRLTYAMWRAARLVIDTGVHAKGWTRAQAQAYLRDNTALSEHEVTTEVDRYISWPAQALSYKLGEIKIMELRRKAERELGPKFDPKAFHDAVLASGSVPLPVLEQLIDAWIARAGEAAPKPAG